MRKKLLSILVVEDDVKVLRQIEWQILSTFNREVQILKAETYEIGKEITLQGLVNISIIDLGLPDGHGEELIALIREKDRYQPIIIQTTEKDLAYQAKVHNKYGRLIYLTKEVLFDELSDRLQEAKMDWEIYASQRLAFPSQSNFDSVDINEVCYVTTDHPHLHIEFYDFDTKTYESIEVKYMTLKEFMNTYNQSGYFLKCHNGYIVNRKMVRSYSRTDNQIKMLYPRKGGYDVLIEVSETYRRNVKNQLRGLY